ncbi:MAG: rRNA small subunit methyltransferase 1 [Myxococcales bacterium FL481]|nr:MAG: rRNA small subunit methyltransferase 1 [Myxococcales bacterium FL481]
METSADLDPPPAGTLVLVGTPLGNRADLSSRARDAILAADLLLCEDTRSPSRLLGAQVGLPPRVSCFAGNEASRVERLLAALGEGKCVVYLSEAGLPVWSDPGSRLVRAAVAAGYAVDVIPAATAASVALCLSGFDANGATFFGFLERSGRGRARALAQVSRNEGPSLLYEAGNRVPGLLRDLAQFENLSTRPMVVARELTKLHQEVRRGSVAELSEQLVEPLRGEVSIVVDGAGPAATGSEEVQVAARRVLELMLDDSMRPRARARELAALTGLAANEIYERLSGSR